MCICACVRACVRAPMRIWFTVSFKPEVKSLLIDCLIDYMHAGLPVWLRPSATSSPLPRPPCSGETQLRPSLPSHLVVASRSSPLGRRQYDQRRQQQPTARLSPNRRVEGRRQRPFVRPNFACDLRTNEGDAGGECFCGSCV